MDLVTINGQQQALGYTSGVVTCLQWCTSQGASIVSISFTAGTVDNPPMEEAIAALSSTVMVAVAAGNQARRMGQRGNRR